MNETQLKDGALIIGAMLTFGAMLKHAFPSFPNRLIPLFTLLGGAAGYAAKTGDWSSSGLTTAFLVAVAATGTHSTLKNLLFGGTPTSEPPDESVKINKGPVLCWLLIPLLALAPLNFTGCATQPQAPQAVAFLALADTWAGVKGAMRLYTDAYAAGKVSEDDRARIDGVYIKFRLSFLAALDLAKHDWSKTTPADVETLAVSILATIDQLNL